MKKLVVKVDLRHEKDRSKAMRVVSGFGGIGSLSVDPKDNKLTVTGDFDPVKVVSKLRKSWHTDIVSVAAAKEDGGKKDEVQVQYPADYPRQVTYYCVPVDEEPGCVIC